eukprot:scaffold51_cov401-Prasinococcus_capsulatus_cf.AAC.32
MSRAVQSFIRVIPKMCLDAASIVIGSPRSLPWPTKKATSSSISTHSGGEEAARDLSLDGAPDTFEGPGG